MIKGIILLIVGVIGLSIVYSFRPPSGFLEGMSMLAMGKNHFISEPIYFMLMGAFGLCAFGGIFFTIKANISGKDQ